MSNQASAKIVCDSVSQEGKRLTTFQLQYWRGIHSELMTHRVFSRNAGSSRARPSQGIIDQVRNHPWGPIHWGKNEPGMQANAELTGDELLAAKASWQNAAIAAANNASDLLDLGAHKQIVNRILEPFTYIDVLVSSTSYNNWWALRDHKDAQPEIQQLAQLMKAEYTKSVPVLMEPGDWHLPYILEGDWELAKRSLMKGRITRDIPGYDEVIVLLRKVSTARCARVSYKTFDGTTSIEKDLELYDRLIAGQPLHASPAEHQATPDAGYEYGMKQCWERPDLHGNFDGWVQHRKLLENEFVPG